MLFYKIKHTIIKVFSSKASFKLYLQWHWTAISSPTPVYWGILKSHKLIHKCCFLCPNSITKHVFSSWYTQCSPKCAFSTRIVSLITGISCLQQLAILFRGRDLFQHIVFCTHIHYESHIHSNKSKPSWYTVFAISTH